MNALIAAWSSDNQELTKVSDRCLDILVYISANRWKDIIQLRKFEAYNEAWLERAFTIHEQIHNLGDCLRRRSSSGVKKTIELDSSSEEDLKTETSRL